eukprot:scaffold22582_cov194-Cylindrotheca_fusiformis.AAC.3
MVVRQRTKVGQASDLIKVVKKVGWGLLQGDYFRGIPSFLCSSNPRILHLARKIVQFYPDAVRVFQTLICFFCRNPTSSLLTGTDCIIRNVIVHLFSHRSPFVMTMLLSLPEDAWRSIALNLPAQDILAFLSCHRQIHICLGKSSDFWGQLIGRDCEKPCHIGGSYEEIRNTYMLHAYTNHLPAVEWHHVTSIPFHIPAREGHLACVLDGPDNEQRVCITGGFSDDEVVYMLHVPPKHKQTAHGWRWSRYRPKPGNGTDFVYGASLTPLGSSIENGCHVTRAVRFGGFQSGGYSRETNQVWLLSIKDEPPTTTGGSSNLTVAWEMVPTTNSHLATPRAYHTATLIGGRYLVIIGGMMWRESICSEAILDTQTWTWTNQQISTLADEKPSGRHGHSVILDTRRNRMVLFGGGSGTNLLRSGKDNSEVWELKMNDDWKSTIKLPWTWSKLHEDSNGHYDNCAHSDDSHGSQDSPCNRNEDNDQTRLSPAESLCLGRCHHGIKVSPDTAILLFGSGRPSTNGLIAYNLREDAFQRPRITGPLPTPSFSGVATYLETEGYLFTHGGYVSQESYCIHDISILDLAPDLNRDFRFLPVDSNFPSYRAINDIDAEEGRNWYRDNFRQQQLMAGFLAMTQGGWVRLDDIEGFFSAEED